MLLKFELLIPLNYNKLLWESNIFTTNWAEMIYEYIMVSYENIYYCLSKPMSI